MQHSTLPRPGRGWWHWLALLVAILISTSVSIANAQSDSAGSTSEAKNEAMIRFETAMKLLNVGKYAEAAAEFEKSIALYPAKGSLFNLGNSYQALHRYVEARKIFQRVKRDYAGQLSADMQDAVDRHLKEIDELLVKLSIQVEPDGAMVSLNGREITLVPGEPLVLDPGDYLVRATLENFEAAEQRVVLRPGETKTVKLVLSTNPGLLAISANVPARLFLDGANKGTLPLRKPLKLAPGEHKIELRHPGYHDLERDVTVPAGERVELGLSLLKIESDRPAPMQTPPKLGTGFWIAAGGTVLATAGSVILFTLSSSRDSQLKDDVAAYEALPSNTAQTTFNSRFNDLDSLQSERDTMATLGWVTGGLAVAGLAATVALGWEPLFASGGQEEQVVVWPTVNGVAGRF